MRRSFVFSLACGYNFPEQCPPQQCRQVAYFHRAIGRRLPQRPAVPDAAELAFRMTLLGKEMLGEKVAEMQ